MTGCLGLPGRVVRLIHASLGCAIRELREEHLSFSTTEVQAALSLVRRDFLQQFEFARAEFDRLPRSALYAIGFCQRGFGSFV